MISDKNFINIAHEIASASKCVSKQVGAVIVKDGRILSTGYNGTPRGIKNCFEGGPLGAVHVPLQRTLYTWIKKCSYVEVLERSGNIG